MCVNVAQPSLTLFELPFCQMCDLIDPVYSSWYGIVRVRVLRVPCGFPIVCRWLWWGLRDWNIQRVVGRIFGYSSVGQKLYCTVRHCIRIRSLQNLENNRKQFGSQVRCEVPVAYSVH
jgi:hypothetical protein